MHLKEMILVMDKKNLSSLGSVRCTNGILAAIADDKVWIKGIDAQSDLDMGLKKLPIQSRFFLGEDNQLFLPDSITPFALLKSLEWQPLLEFIKVEAPIACLPGKIKGKIPIRLVPSVSLKEAAGLLTSLTVWKNFAESASDLRLRANQFAVSESREVFIIGQPLPSIPGMEYWRLGDIFLPAGYDFEFPFVASFFNRERNLSNEAILLFDKGGDYQKIEKSFFVEGRRSAIRLTNIQNG